MRRLVEELLPVATAMRDVALRRNVDADTKEMSLQHAATLVSLAFQVWQVAERGVWQESRDVPIFQGYVSILTDTVRQWLSWDIGALCLMSAASAAAVHDSIRELLLRGGIDGVLDTCRGEQSWETVPALNRESLTGLLDVLRAVPSSPSHAEARARPAGTGFRESEEESARRDAAVVAAARRPEAPPFVDAEAAWKARANRATRDIADMEVDV